MKRILALVLCSLMLIASFSSCTTLKDEDKGAVIDVYLTNEIYDFDPARCSTDVSASKFLSLVFEGLTKLDENGKWKKALMNKYTVSQDDDEAYKIQITLNETKWSDSRPVQANDVVFAWKRVLDPDIKCEAASMLFDIKNAYDIKHGDASVDDLGVSAIETYVLEIEFTHKVDLDAFFTNTASIALVPLREDIVATNPNWAKKASSLITNGPFDVKEYSNGGIIRLERSAYYYRDTEKDGPLDEYVVPYRIITHYEYGTLSDQLDAFLSGKIFYLGEIPLDKRAEYSEYANVYDYPATHTYLFNEKNELLSDPDVRRALSLAIDRNAVADLVVYADPATGVIPPVTYGADQKTTFRSEGGDLLSASADKSEAKRLLSKAGVSGGELTISVRNDEVDLAVAEYVKGVWEELGLTVSIETLKYSVDSEDSTIVVDNFYEAYISGDYDVIAVDLTVLTSDAFSALAPFAKDYSGFGVNMDLFNESEELYLERTHCTGYDSDQYNALFEKYFETTDTAERNSILHEAERMLIDDSVVMPIYFEKDAFMYSSVLSKIGSVYYGRDFNDLRMKDYLKYKQEHGIVD